MTARVLVLPGIGNSGTQHWQSLWEQATPDFERVIQRDWDNPVCAEWCAALENAARRAGPNVVLAAHSLACLVVAHWAAQPHAPVRAALLVAVPDPAGPNFPQQAAGFLHTPMRPLSFPSIVVASTDDPYGTLDHSARVARAWNSRLVNIGASGHINAGSGLGAWPEGFALLSALRG